MVYTNRPCHNKRRSSGAAGLAVLGVLGVLGAIIASTAAPASASTADGSRLRSADKGLLAPIGRALSLFSAQEMTTMPRVVLATVKLERSTRDTEGYAVPGYPVIYIAAWSDTYKAAVTGDHTAIVKLAGIIAHERVHVERGPDERPAYEAEILMLRRCGAPPILVDGVRRSMRASGF